MARKTELSAPKSDDFQLATHLKNIFLHKSKRSFSNIKIGCDIKAKKT